MGGKPIEQQKKEKRNKPGRRSRGIATPPLFMFEDQTPSGQPIRKCHSDQSISRSDGLWVSSSDTASIGAWMFRFWELETSILSKSQLGPIGSQNRLVGVTFSDGSSTRRTPPTAFFGLLGKGNSFIWFLLMLPHWSYQQNIIRSVRVDADPPLNSHSTSRREFSFYNWGHCRDEDARSGVSSKTEKSQSRFFWES